MSKDLTEKQYAIFKYIKDRIIESGFPPTVREIGDKFSITVKGAYDHLKAIEKKGFIRCTQNKSRAIELLKDKDDMISSDSLNVPLVGRIAAGSPILAQENVEEYLSFPRSMFKSGEFFALKVKGDSMVEAGIQDGDLAVIQKQNTANNGEIVAAMIDDEATLKTFKKIDSKIHLIPANISYKPIILDNVDILGKLAALFRKY
jgi:repressor LexA